MTRLRTKMLRDLRHMGWRALAIVLTVAAGVAVYAGFYAGIRSLFWTRDSIHRELNFADLEVRFLPDDARNLPDLSGIGGVARIEERLVTAGTVRPPGQRPLTVIMTSLAHPTPGIHSFRFLDGRPFGAGELDAVVIDASLSSYHGYRVGDRIEIKVGEAVYRRRVVGIAITPEYFVSTSNPGYFIPEKGSLGFVFGNLEGLADALGFRLVNDLVFRFEAGADPARVKQDVLARLRKLNIEQVTPAERHFGHQYVQVQLESMRLFVPALVAVLVGLTFIVVSVNVNRMIATDRREIGALMALGHGPGTLLRTYLEATLALTLAGGVLGLLSSLWVRDLFATVSGTSMGMPEIRTALDVPAMARGLGWELATALTATAIPVLRLVRLPAQRVIRDAPALSVPRRVRALAGPGSPLGRLPTGYRYALRNLARRRGRTAVTLLSIALALGVATAYRLSLTSIDTTLSRYLQHDRWDLAVDFLHPVLAERLGELEAIPGVARTETYCGCYVQLHAGGRVDDSTLVGLDTRSALMTVNVVDGRTFRDGPEHQAVLTRELAARLGLGVGDLFEVEVATRRHPVRLVGLSWAAVAGLSLVPLPTAREICQLPDRVSGAYVAVSGDVGEATARIQGLEFAGKVLAKRDLLAQIRNVLSALIAMLDLSTAVSLLMAVLVVLTTINLSVLESERDFATLQVLGHGRRLVVEVVLTEACAYAVGAVCLAVPIAVAISMYLNERMGAAWVHIDNALAPAPFATVLGPALVLIPLGCYPGIRRVVSGAALASLRSRTLD